MLGSPQRYPYHSEVSARHVGQSDGRSRSGRARRVGSRGIARHLVAEAPGDGRVGVERRGRQVGDKVGMKAPLTERPCFGVADGDEAEARRACEPRVGAIAARPGRTGEQLHLDGARGRGSRLSSRLSRVCLSTPFHKFFGVDGRERGRGWQYGGAMDQESSGGAPRALGDGRHRSRVTG